MWDYGVRCKTKIQICKILRKQSRVTASTQYLNLFKETKLYFICTDTYKILRSLRYVSLISTWPFLFPNLCLQKIIMRRVIVWKLEKRWSRIMPTMVIVNAILDLLSTVAKRLGNLGDLGNFSIHLNVKYSYEFKRACSFVISRQIGLSYVSVSPKLQILRRK